MTTTTRKVTKRQGEAVLTAVAAWMGRNGFGTPICPQGRELGGLAGMRHTDDKTWCDDCTFGPAPTGSDAAYRGLGPELNMNYNGYPAIVLEGGMEEWAIRCSYDIQQEMDAKGIPVFLEPYYSFVLSIYPN